MTHAPDASPDRSDGWTQREAPELASGAVSLAVGALPARALATERSLEDATVRTSTIELTVNGRRQRLDLGPRTSVLDLLREDLQLGGSKKGVQPERLRRLQDSRRRPADQRLPDARNHA